MNQQTINRYLHTLGVFLSLSLWPTTALSQTEIRNLSGTVTDRQKEPLGGATVQVENRVTMGVRSYVTNHDGKYSFKRLRGDTDYRFWVSFRGHKSRVRELSQFDSDQQKTVNFVLKVH